MAAFANNPPSEVHRAAVDPPPDVLGTEVDSPAADQSDASEQAALAFARLEDIVNDIHGAMCPIVPLDKLQECKDSEDAFSGFVADLKQLLSAKIRQRNY